ncbi:hypothetical protein CA600_14390 [Paenibacillus sp. VTT E-133280]|uniref:hypothetical protein n=1 Tax=Paenibacillus sp. VTT E-133280 TaxID=1986222 RepID=UPI000BA0A2AF|nr:hypothetical protein [Paenibacillus sp. VTT E-133280]OZQ65271.1 hypothetical protein CA600_14390 [Paenibacillus sp. VTT E-133280]
MHKLRTVRIHYLYVFIGSALLSAAFLFAVQRVVALLYAHYSGQSGVFFVRLIHWTINHIGTIPSAIILFVLFFSGLFILRSQKIADDLHTILLGTSELADQGRTQEIKVLSGGELGQIAANLNRTQRIEVPNGGAVTGTAGDTPAVALLIRTRAILRALREVEEADNSDDGMEAQALLEAANVEARSMERFLENLIIES